MHSPHTLAPLLQSSWSPAAPLTGLDIAFANLLHHKQASDDPRHRWLAALTSHQWGRGHACLDLRVLRSQAAELLGWRAEQTAALPADLCDAAATLPWTQGEASPLVWQHDAQGERLYLRRAWTAEQHIRQHIAQRLGQPSDAPTDLSARLDALFPNSPGDGAPDLQRRACEVAAQHRITLITGGPGTGKTTTVVRLLALLVGNAPADRPLRMHLAAPTGKAAARLSESISRALSDMPEHVRARIPTQTQTLHRLLHSTRVGPTTQQLATDVVVVDEASMVDLEMMARLLHAVPLHARLILLGDKDQLASVEAGAVMSQLCTGPLLRQQTVTLTQSHRFDARSGIGRWAQAVNDDQTPEATRHAAVQALWQAAPDWLSTLDAPHDVTRLQLSHAGDPRLGAGLRHGWREWLALLAPHRDGAPCNDAQALALLHSFAQFCVLCAVREGPLGVTQLNTHIAHALGLGLGANPWYAGRPVMVTRNDYALDVMNGDIGLCLPSADGRLRVALAHPSGGVRWLVPSRLDSVETVFAMTVHKSQGSEFNHVLLVLPAQDVPVLSRELVYTGLTRARTRLSVWAPNTQVLWDACARRVLRSGGLGHHA